MLGGPLVQTCFCVWSVVLATAAVMRLAVTSGWLPICGSFVISVCLAGLLFVLLAWVYRRGTRRVSAAPRRTVLVAILLLSATCGWGVFRELMVMHVTLVEDGQHDQLLLLMDDVVVIMDCGPERGSPSTRDAGEHSAPQNLARPDQWMSWKTTQPFTWEDQRAAIQSLSLWGIRMTWDAARLEYTKTGRLTLDGRNIPLDGARRGRLPPVSRQPVRLARNSNGQWGLACEGSGIGVP
jgi:hypothetical protein